MAKSDADPDGATVPSNGRGVDRPGRVLPTNRVAFPKQLEILRGFGALGSTTRPVSNMEVSRVVGLHNATIGLVTPFLAEAGLLRRTPEGFLPAEEVVRFNQTHQWSPDTAAHRLAPLLLRSWFAEAIVTRLRFSPMGVDTAVAELGQIANAGPNYKGHLENLVDYLVVSGLVVREENQLRLPSRAGRDEPEREEEAQVSMSLSEPSPVRQQPPAASPVANDTTNVVQFNISVKVNMAEMATWDAQRIQAFFAGIAQVLAAKGEMEKATAGA